MGASPQTDLDLATQQRIVTLRTTSSISHTACFHLRVSLNLAGLLSCKVHVRTTHYDGDGNVQWPSAHTCGRCRLKLACCFSRPETDSEELAFSSLSPRLFLAASVSVCSLLPYPDGDNCSVMIGGRRKVRIKNFISTVLYQ